MNSDKRWYVETRYSGTGIVSRKSRVFQSREAAEAAAEKFNKNNQDRTWNCEVAYVEESR